MASELRLDQLPSYAKLRELADKLRKIAIIEFLTVDAARACDFTCSAAGLQLDYSKQLIDRNTRETLWQLAAEAELPARIQDLLNGAEVNNTERRPALHTLLRAGGNGALADKYREVVATREAMRVSAEKLISGQHRGFTDAAITDVVNIGIGGSDLGPRLVTEALRPYQNSIACHYVANVDPADLQDTLLDLVPETTLFIVCSKSFRTEETLTNSLVARDWMRAAGASDSDLRRHFLAITTNLEAATEFGIPRENCLPMWDWVGGRYSVWSAIGLSCAIAVGWDNFQQFLAGAGAMDRHLAEAPIASNMPIMLSLLEVWNRNLLGAGNHAVLPYDQSLVRLPDFLQQLTMESNGKRVALDGGALDYPTGPVLWGSAGTMGQHSFHQLLHQGTELCPADFVLPLTTHTGMHKQHRRLVANCLAQSRALLLGRTEAMAKRSLLSRGYDEERATALAPHLAMPGNRPHNVISMQSLTPATLGALLALYEHRTYCSSVLWGVNAFDQWGVELGKEIGAQILTLLEDASRPSSMDPATNRLISEWRRAQAPEASE
ncbi:glucose-6-phosphate isomerase [Mangrovimicrobium sediminis]|uniref:Glucose-6-phosphate isomerase n=1 Tax=Mangrovimicrobium sediminis TaxID=2562682 RepID=A0A4Z0M430_9GAMM|nr:glucose-6-phosphate isomerase [Haliea sp. SAOS-164]TGD74187.1 glucose-6-phosphate isomerase [Haliea sp. SAOS-164]